MSTATTNRLKAKTTLALVPPLTPVQIGFPDLTARGILPEADEVALISLEAGMSRILSLALCGVLLSFNPCLADDDARDRLMNEAPVAWATQEELCRNVVGVLSVTQEQTDKEPVVTRYRLAINGDLMKAEIEGSTIPIRAINKNYLFGLKSNQDGRSYFIHTLEDKDSLSPNALEEVNFQTNQLRNYAGMSHRYWGMPLSQLLLDSQFTIHRVSYVDGDIEQFVRVDFEYQATDPSDRAEQGSFLVLDSENAWRVTRSSKISEAFVQVEGDIVKRLIAWNSEFAYDEPRDSLQVVKRAILHWDEPELGFEVRDTFEFEKFERAVVPESEFTLSAYGLPEPDMIALRSRLTLPQLMQDAMCRIGQAAAARQSAASASVDDE